MILDAGCDQFGGEARPELIIQLVESGRVALSRLDQSARRLLAAKFALGLFDRRHVDPHRAGRIVGNAEFISAGLDAQRRSHTLLTNRDDLLPLGRGVRIYVENIDPEIAGHYAQLVDTPQEADVAVIRLQAPYELRPGGLQALFHAGSLEYPADQRRRHLELCATVPTVAGVYLDRPAVLTHLADHAQALIAGYGSTDQTFLDIVFGLAEPEGRLPFDLPSSMTAVIASRPDIALRHRGPALSLRTRPELSTLGARVRPYHLNYNRYGRNAK